MAGVCGVRQGMGWEEEGRNGCEEAGPGALSPWRSLPPHERSFPRRLKGTVKRWQIPDDISKRPPPAPLIYKYRRCRLTMWGKVEYNKNKGKRRQRDGGPLRRLMKRSNRWVGNRGGYFFFSWLITITGREIPARSPLSIDIRDPFVYNRDIKEGHC